MKYWEFTGEEKTVFGATLKRIRATAKFTLTSGIVVEAGENGGWIEKEENLSGNAWVSGDAMVLGNARVFDNALVRGNAWVLGNAQVYDYAMVLDNARVYGDAQVYGHAVVYDYAQVNGHACVHERALVSDDAWVFSNAQVSGYAHVFSDAQVSDYAHVGGYARVGGLHVLVRGNALVYDEEHYLQIGPAGSRNDYTTFMRNKKGVIYVSCGCFFGSITEFRKKVLKTHGHNKHAMVYLAAADLAELQIDTTPIEDEPELPKKEGENA